MKSLVRRTDTKIMIRCGYMTHTTGYSPGSENIPVEKSSAPRFETWNGSRDPSETNLAWLDFLNMGQFCAIDHALF